jgi:hypothetical protein
VHGRRKGEEERRERNEEDEGEKEEQQETKKKRISLQPLSTNPGSDRTNNLHIFCLLLILTVQCHVTVDSNHQMIIFCMYHTYRPIGPLLLLYIYASPSAQHFSKSVNHYTRLVSN